MAEPSETSSRHPLATKHYSWFKVLLGIAKHNLNAQMAEPSETSSRHPLATKHYSWFKVLLGIAKHNLNAQMAELVDALVSGTSISNGVQVRVLFWAPVITEIFFSVSYGRINFVIIFAAIFE